MVVRLQRSLFEFLKLPEAAPPRRDGGRRKFVDLFSGIGGASQGATQAGYDVVLAVDACEHALQVHKRNHPAARHICTTLPARFELPLPSEREDWHLHGSPPCTKLSKANQERDEGEREDALATVRWYLDFALASSASTWSMEEVASQAIVALLERYRAPRAAHRNQVDYLIIKCQEHGLPSMRRRLVAGSPKLIARMRRLPRVRRSVREVLPQVRGTHLRNEVWWGWNVPLDGPVPATHEVREGARFAYKRYGPDECCLPIDGLAHCITARHTLRWATPHTGTPLKLMTARETAVMQSFPATYTLDDNKQRAIRGLGNAFPPCVAERLFGGTGPPTRPQSPSLRRPAPVPTWRSAAEEADG